MLRKKTMRVVATLFALSVATVAGAARADGADGCEMSDCPETLPYQKGQSVPYGYRVVQEPRKGPLVAGAILFGGAYSMSVVVAASNKLQHGSAYLLVPLMGPLTAGSGGRCSFSGKDEDCAGPSFHYLLALDTLVQVGGAALVIIGLSHTRDVLRRKDLAGLTIVPSIVPSIGRGLSIGGTF
jgi:hypothetical protein